MTELYLIRHGAYTLQDKPPFDLGLTAEGRLQAERLRDRLVGSEIAADVLISSPMPRALQTAQIIAPALNNLPIVLNDEVQEWRNSEGHDLPFEEFVRQFMATPASERPFYAPAPGVERWTDFIFRIGSTLQRITQEYAGQKIVIVGHGGTIEASFNLFMGLSLWRLTPIGLDPAYTSLTVWRNPDPPRTGWLLESYNDIGHLKNWPNQPV